MAHVNESCGMWVTWGMNESYHIWRNHVTYERVISHMPCHIWISHASNEWDMSLLTESCHTVAMFPNQQGYAIGSIEGRVHIQVNVAHIQISYISRMNLALHHLHQGPCQCTRKNHGTHINVSCATCSYTVRHRQYLLFRAESTYS